MDWGFKKPAGALWFCSTNDGDIIVCNELYTQKHGKPNVGAETPPEVVREKIGMIEHARGWDVRERWMDPATWSEHGQEESIASVLSGTPDDETQLYWKPWPKGPGSRVRQKQVVHQLLSITNGESRLKIMDNCEHLIRTLFALPADKNNVEDVDTDAEDHLYDALRGGLCKKVPTASDIRLFDKIDRAERHELRQRAESAGS